MYFNGFLGDYFSGSVMGKRGVRSKIVKGIVLLCAIIFSQTMVCAADFEEGILLNKIVSIDCQYESVNDVLLDISRQSGVEITYNYLLENDEIVASIAFIDDVRAIDAVNRLLRGKNTIIEFNKELSNLHIVMFDQTF